MAQLLVRDIDDRTMTLIKEQANLHRRSVQGEIRAILDETAQSAGRMTWDEFNDVAKTWKERLSGRIAGDSVDLLHEGRER